MIDFGGISSADVRLVVQHYPHRIIAQRKYSTATVPGRSGDLLDMQDAWANYTQTYKVFLRGGRRGDVPEISRSVAAWLTARRGYQRLVDSYEPNCYRMAYFIGPLDIEDRLSRYGQSTLSFVCTPQRYLFEGENEISVPSSGAAVYNPTAFPARPLLKITTAGAGTVTVAGKTVSILGNTSFSPLCIDCSTGEVYTVSSQGVRIDRNASISALELPELPAGETSVSWTGSVSAVQLIPRWWTL